MFLATPTALTGLMVWYGARARVEYRSIQFALGELLF
jgi:hypothetical protein